MTGLKSNRVFFILLFLIGSVLLYLALFTDENGGGGDSFGHYLFARYAWKYPALFFDHWAKPVFTILCSPFAQFGFKGVKVFNVFVSLIACYFTYLTAKFLSIKNAFLIAVLYFSATLTVTVTLTGLTEPLFSFVVALALYLFVAESCLSATLVISFLPLVRSEGLVILCVIAVYLLVQKKYKLIPLLFAGQAIIALSGMSFYDNNLLWVFNKIPYAKMRDNYGSGSWDHFIIQMNFMIGPVLYFLLLAGCLGFLLQFKKEIGEHWFREKFLLIYGCFIAFFTAHSIFWTFGIFNSMGLSRVFVGVMPLIILITLIGLNYMLSLIKSEVVVTGAMATIMLAVVIFPFLNNPASYDFKTDFSLNETHKMLKDDLIPFLNKKYPDHKIYSSSIDIPFFMDIDVFDKSVYGELKHVRPAYQLKNSEVLIWDNWVSVVEENIKKEELMSTPTLRLDTSFNLVNAKGDEVEYAVFARNE